MPASIADFLRRLLHAGATLVRRHPVRFACAVTAAWLLVHLLLLLGYFGSLDVEGGQKHGLLAKDLWEGLLAPIGRYQVRKWEGGAMPYKLFAGLFFGFLGPSNFALKLAGIVLFGLLAVWPLVDLARRAGGAAAAWTMAAALVLPCPFVANMTLWAGSVVPTHLGLTIFSGHALWFLHRGFVARDLRPGVAIAGLGTSLGLGLYWTLAFAPVLAGIGVAMILLRVRVRHLVATALASLPSVALAVALTIAPYLAGSAAGPLTAVREGLAAGHGALAFAREAARTLFVFLPETAGIRPDGDGSAGVAAAFSAGYDLLLLAGLAGIVLGLRRGALRPAARLALAYALPAAFVVAAFIATGASIGTEHFNEHRYFLPALPFVLLAIALGLPLFGRALGRPSLAAGAALLLVSLGGASLATVFDPGVFPTPYLRERGYNFYFFDHRGDPSPFARGLTLSGRSDYVDLASRLGALAPGAAEIASGPDVPGLDPRLNADFWEGAGEAAHTVWRSNPRAVAEVIRFVAGLPAQDPRRAWLRGFGRRPPPHEAAPGVADPPLVVRRALRQSGPDRLGSALRDVYRGMGQVLWAVGGVPTADPFQAAYEADLARGVADTVGRRIHGDAPWPDDAPWPPEGSEAAAQFPQAFPGWVEAERRRVAAIRAAFAERPPLALR